VNWIRRWIARLLGAKPQSKHDRNSTQDYVTFDAAGVVTPVAVSTPARSSDEGDLGASFPRFQSTASDRVDSRSADRLASLRMKFRNAYTPSLPVSDRRRFAGREEVLNAIISALEDQRLHVIIYGDRGMGKTSVLHVLSQAARESRYIVAYVSCGEASTFDETFRAVAAEIPALFHADVAPTDSKLQGKATLADMLPEEPITPRYVADLFGKLVGTRVLVMLDEFDRAESREFRRSVAEVIKDLSDRSVRTQIIISGVASDLMELFEFIPSIRRNIFALQIPRMQPAEVRRLVKAGEQSSGLIFTPEATDFVVFVANGSPYLASLLSHHAGLATLDQGLPEVSPEDVSAGVDRCLQELSGRISRASHLQIERCGERLRSALALIAGGALFTGGRFADVDIEALYTNPKDAAKCRSMLDSLSAENALIEADVSTKGFRFLEGSVPPYLWMDEARRRFQKNDEAPVVERSNVDAGNSTDVSEPLRT